MNNAEPELVLPYVIPITDDLPISDYISEISIDVGNSGTVLTRIKLAHPDVYYQVTSDTTVDFMVDIEEDTEFESTEIPYPEEVLKGLAHCIRTDTYGS